MKARNFSEWFAFHGGEEAVVHGVTREDFLRCWKAAINANDLARIQDYSGKPLTVKGIIKQYLRQNGFDGLYNPGECACQLSDLVPCDSDPSSCEAGYKSDCPGADCNLGGDCGFHIGPKKTAPEPQQTTIGSPASPLSSGYDPKPPDGGLRAS